jgi:predicted transcriptional regulator
VPVTRARREHALILGDILDALDRMHRDGGRMSLAGLASRANLPHDRLKVYLDELRARAMVGPEPLPTLTARGQQFLECYQGWIRIQRLYGIESAGLTPAFTALA